MSNELKLHQRLISYLLIAIPFLLITGPFLSDLAVVIICILFLFNHFIFKIKKYLKNYFFILFLFFYLTCILSSLFSEYPSISVFKSIFYIRFLIITFAIVYILENDPKFINKIFISIFICFSILIFDGFYQFIFEENIFGFMISGNRVSSFFGDELIYGSYISKFFPIFLALFFLLKKKSFKLNLLFSFILVLSIYSITISGERSALFLILMTLAYLMIMLKLNIKILAIFFIIILTGIYSLVTLNDSIKDRMVDFTKDQILTEDKIYFFSEDHTGHYLSAIDIFKNNNMLIGIGPKNYRNYCYNNDKYKSKPFICSPHPHNTYIQVLTETGIIGFMIVSSAYLFLLFLSFKYLYFRFFKKKFIFNNIQISLFSFYIMILWPIVPTGNFFNNYLSIIYYIPVGFLIWSFNYFKNLNKTKYI